MRLLIVLALLAPCTTLLADDDLQHALQRGEALWNDTTLSSNERSCNSCHADGKLLKFETPFPKPVGMAGGMQTLDQIINFCMEKPMQAEALPWDSADLTALATWHEHMAGRR